ncbi:MAG: prepilin-type N-terminal cleavage/methylation domain-containing protein [Myxococcota bacterium]
MRPPAPPRPRGFTLVETMITLAILSTGMLGLMAMQIASVRGVQVAAETSLATNLASSALDDLTLVDYTTLQATGIPGFPRKYDKHGTDLASTASNEFFQVTAAVVTVSGTYVDIRVQTTWKNEMRPSVNRVVTLNGRVRQRGGT